MKCTDCKYYYVNGFGERLCKLFYDVENGKNCKLKMFEKK